MLPSLDARPPAGAAPAVIPEADALGDAPTGSSPLTALAEPAVEVLAALGVLAWVSALLALVAGEVLHAVRQVRRRRDHGHRLPRSSR